MGLRQAKKHSPAAFLGSISQTSGLVKTLTAAAPSPTSPDLTPAIHRFNELSDSALSLPITTNETNITQKSLSHAIDLKSHRDLLSSTTDHRNRARLNSVSLPHAGEWLTVTPSPSLGLHLHPIEFRNSALYRLGRPLFPGPSECPRCPQSNDEMGDHAVGCRSDGDRIARHDRLRDAIFTAARTAALAPQRELPNLIPGSQDRPADIYIGTWKRGRPAAFDVTVISPLQSSTVKNAASEPSSALELATRRKRQSHDQDCHDAGIDFVPLPVETLGGWSADAISTIKEIARLAAQRSGQDPRAAPRHLLQRLGIILQRGNISLWIRRIAVVPPHVDGVL